MLNGICSVCVWPFKEWKMVLLGHERRGCRHPSSVPGELNGYLRNQLTETNFMCRDHQGFSFSSRASLFVPRILAVIDIAFKGFLCRLRVLRYTITLSAEVFGSLWWFNYNWNLLRLSYMGMWPLCCSKKSRNLPANGWTLLLTVRLSSQLTKEGKRDLRNVWQWGSWELKRSIAEERFDRMIVVFPEKPITIAVKSGAWFNGLIRGCVKLIQEI